MTPKKHIQLSVILLSFSVCAEAAFMTELNTVSETVYSIIHLVLMAVLIISQLLLSQKIKTTSFNYARWFAAGTFCTAIGDYVNSSISFVNPVSNKLTFALFSFGIGYAIYNIVLWKINQELFKNTFSSFSKRKYFFAIPFVIINLISWLQHVEPNLRQFHLLYYGSFVFNITIYVAMPLFALWYYRNTNWNIKGLLIFIGALLIPYSDLILFNSWLKGGANPTHPDLILYAANWILYYGGQVLISLFPAFVAMDSTISDASK